MLNVTFNDICDSTEGCRRTEEEVGPTVGLPRHGQFVGFFNVPVQAPAWNESIAEVEATILTTCPLPAPTVNE